MRKNEVGRIIIAMVLVFIVTTFATFITSSESDSFMFQNLWNNYASFWNISANLVLALLVYGMPKIFSDFKDRNISLFVRFKTTVGVSAIILDEDNRILLVKSKKDNKDFFQQPGTRYRIRDFKQPISGSRRKKNISSPVVKLLATIKAETGIIASDIEFMHFFGDYRNWNLATNPEGDSLANENIDSNYQKNYIIPPPFLIEAQDRNNISASDVSTIDLFFAFCLREGALYKKENIEFKSRQEINAMIMNDIEEGGISTHHDLVVIVNRFYDMLSQSKPKVDFSLCRFSELSETTDKPAKISEVKIDDDTLLNPGLVPFFPPVTPKDIYVIRKGRNQTETKQFKRCLDAFKNTNQTIVLDIEDIPDIGTDSLGEWDFFQQGKRIALFRIHHSNEPENTMKTLDKLRIYCDSLEYVVDFDVLRSSEQTIVENCKRLHIKRLMVEYQHTADKAREVHQFITRLSNSTNPMVEQYTWINVISFMSDCCERKECGICSNKTEKL